MGSAVFFIVLFCSPICRAAGGTMGLPQFSWCPPHWLMTLICGVIGIAAIFYVKQQSAAAHLIMESAAATNAAAAAEVRAAHAKVAAAETAAADEVRAAHAKVAAAETAAAAEVRTAHAAAAASAAAKDVAEAELRCELRSFTATEVSTLSPASRDEFMHLCAKHGVRLPPPDNDPDPLSQVPPGDHKVPPEASCTRDGRACEGAGGGSSLRVI